nr:MFS transporter [Pseudovibrio flavus]
MLVPSALADWLDFVALLVLAAYGWAQGPYALAAITMAAGLPRVLFALPAGTLVDRVGAAPVLVASLFVRAFLLLGMFYFATNIYALLAFVFLKSSVSALYVPAQQSLLKAIVPEKLLVKAVGIDQSIIQSAKVIAPVLGGSLLAIWSPHMVFLLAAGMFGVSFLFSLSLRSVPSREDEVAPEDGKPPNKNNAWAELKEGFVYISRSSALLVPVTLFSGAMFAIFLYDSLLLLLLSQIGVEDKQVGIVFGALGLGGLLGAVVAGPLCERFGSYSVLIGSLLYGAFGSFVAGFLPLLPFEIAINHQLIMWFCFGMAITLSSVPYSALLLKNTPSQMVGRVTSFGEALVNAARLIAPPIGALLADWGALSLPFFAASGIFVFLTGAGGLCWFVAIRPNRTKATT